MNARSFRRLAVLAVCVGCGGGVPDAGVANPTAPSGTPSTGGATPVSVPSAAADFRGNVVLGAPTTTSVRANLYASAQSGTAYLAFGTASGTKLAPAKEGDIDLRSGARIWEQGYGSLNSP